MPVFHELFLILLTSLSCCIYASRVDRASFQFLVDLIWYDEVFVSAGRKPQRPPWYQLAVFLNWYGLTPIQKTAEESSIGEGTVYLYCARVVQAFQRIRPRFLCWPDRVRKEEIKGRMDAKGFLGCIGMVNGSLIWLALKPVKDGELYFYRKKIYAVCTLHSHCSALLIFNSLVLFLFSVSLLCFSFLFVRSSYKPFATIQCSSQNSTWVGQATVQTQRFSVSLECRKTKVPIFGMMSLF